MSFSSLLITTAAVYTPTRTQNNFGATEEVYTVSIASLPCRIQAASTRFGIKPRSMSGTLGVEVTHKLYCLPNATAISEGDEIRVGTDIYRVNFVNDVDQMAHHWELDLVEHRPDRHGR